MRRYWQIMQLGQPNTAIKYSREPIGNSIRIGWGNCFNVKKVIDHYSFSSSKRSSYCQQELDKTDYGTGAQQKL
jgi:hypothetical protein